jgi:hypothetical protein
MTRSIYAIVRCQERLPVITRSASAGRRRRIAWLVVPAAGLTLAACGASGDRNSPSGASSRSSTVEHRERRQVIIAAVAACRHGVDTASWMSPADKQRLYEVCNYGLHRGLTEIKVYGLQVCREVTFASPAKTAAEKARSFSTCYAETKQRTAAIK